jgi:uncharacterized protein (DUF849 family)
MSPLIINLAPTGVRPSKAQNPAVPLTHDEIVADADAAVGLGASMVHLHVRDAAGVPVCDADAMGDVIAAIRARRPDAVLVSSTTGRAGGGLEDRLAPLFLEGRRKPDMASLTLSSLNFTTGASVNSPETVEALARAMRDQGVRPELEVFDLGMVNMAKVLIRKGLVEAPYYFNILLGNVATAQATLLHLAVLVADLPEGSVWSVAGIGNAQPRMIALGAAVADGVRVGLEDNLWLDEARAEPATNADLVRRAARLAEASGRGVATAAEVRARLGLPARP